MRKQGKIIAVMLLIGVCAYFAIIAVQGHRRKVQLYLRIHDIKQLGMAYALYANTSGVLCPLRLTELRTHLPVGFPLYQYEAVALGTNDLDSAFLREVTPDADGRRAVFFLDGHAALVHN